MPPSSNTSNTIDKAIAAAMGNLNEAKKEIESMSSQKMELETTVQGLRGEKNQLEETIKKLKRDLSDLEDQLTETQDELLMHVFTTNNGDGKSEQGDEDLASHLVNESDMEDRPSSNILLTPPPPCGNAAHRPEVAMTSFRPSATNHNACDDDDDDSNSIRSGMSLDADFEGEASVSINSAASDSSTARVVSSKKARAYKRAFDCSPKKWRRMIRNRRLQSIFFKVN